MNSEILKILIVEDNEALRKQIKWAIEGNFELIEAGDRDEALKGLKEKPDIVLLDLHLPPDVGSINCGLDILGEIERMGDPPQVIVITAERNKQLAFELVERGVFDYLEKPIDPDELNFVIKRALYRRSLEQEIKNLRRELISGTGFENLIGKSEKMLKIYEKIEKVAPTDANVLILGESGTGKELVARAIHKRSKRRGNPFVPVDLSAIPENLMESELFGYEKGAFTGAMRSKPGRLEEANGGTIFFDEIGNLSLPIQAKLLRFLEDREIRRLGGKRSIKLDVRIISATNRNLEEMMKREEFREDLYYRLKTVVIELPPLRERREDIETLALHFLKKYSSLYGKKMIGIDGRAMEMLLNYEWPGNVRELEHTIENAVVLSSGNILSENDIKLGGGISETVVPVDLKDALREMEKKYVEEALKKAKGDRKKASELLGIDIHQLKYLIKKHKIH